MNVSATPKWAMDTPGSSGMTLPVVGTAAFPGDVPRLSHWTRFLMPSEHHENEEFTPSTGMIIWEAANLS